MVFKNANHAPLHLGDLLALELHTCVDAVSEIVERAQKAGRCKLDLTITFEHSDMLSTLDT